MTKKHLVQLMKQYKPSTPQETEHVLGTKLRLIGAGCFREAFQPKACPSVAIKFPHDEYGPIHACIEVRRIKKLRRVPELRGHVPEVFYFDKEAGITIVPYAAPPTRNLDELEAVYRLLSKLIRRLAKTELKDVFGNVGIDGYNRLVITDVGY